MTGPTFALLSALSFAFAAFYTRRAVIKDTDIILGVLISILISLPFFILILIISGQIKNFHTLSLGGVGLVVDCGHSALYCGALVVFQQRLARGRKYYFNPAEK